jgi:hypothetical protein
MAKLVTYKNGVQLMIGRLTKEQEREFFRRTDTPIAWFRGTAANLGQPRKRIEPQTQSPGPHDGRKVLALARACRRPASLSWRSSRYRWPAMHPSWRRWAHSSG